MDAGHDDDANFPTIQVFTVTLQRNFASTQGGDAAFSVVMTSTIRVQARKRVRE